MRTSLIVVGYVLLATSLAHVSRFVPRDPDVWWTPLSMARGIEESSDAVEVYVDGKRLDRDISAGRVLLVADGGTRAVDATEVRVRLNNADRVTTAQLPLVAAASAGGLGGALALVAGLAGVRFSRPRPEGSAGAASGGR